MWPTRFYSISFSFPERNRDVESNEEGGLVLDFGQWAGSAPYLCAIVLLRAVPESCVCSLLWLCCRFEPAGSCSLGIWSFQIKLYLALVSINLQFSPWFILGMYIMRNLKKQEGRKWKFALCSVFLIYDLCGWNRITQWCILSPVFHVSSVTIETKCSVWYGRNGVSSSCRLVAE